MGIEHRLATSRHPQTNGMVERFHGRIYELLQRTCFDSQADLEMALKNYLKLYKTILRRELSAPKLRFRPSRNDSTRNWRCL